MQSLEARLIKEVAVSRPSLIGLVASFAFSLTIHAAVSAYPATILTKPPKAPEPVRAPVKPPAMATLDHWVVEGANHRCLATRKFGEPANPVALTFKILLFHGISGMVIEPKGATNTIGAKLQLFEFGRADFGAGDPAPTRMRIAGMAGGMQVVQFYLTHNEFVAMRQSGDLWTYSKHHNRRFKLPAMADVGKLLDSCEEALAAEYGLPIDEQRKLAVLPVENSKGYVFTSDDYPMEALRRNLGALTMVAVTIEANGKASRCDIVDRSNVPELDRKTCSVLMSRGRFTPARDISGRAVRALFPFQVMWITPS